MFAGHLGAGLLLKRVQPKVGLGTLFLSAMLLDFVLWVLVLFGIESTRVPKDFKRMVDLQFDFPYSHSLRGSVLWSAGAGSLFFVFSRKPTPKILAAIIVGIAVLSHFALDWVVHVPELPLAGRGSHLIGIGLWRVLPLAWCLETILAAAGLAAYLPCAKLPKSRVISLVFVMLIVTAFTILGQASHSAPPPAAAMAGTSLLSIVLLTMFGWWVELKAPVR